MGVKLGNAKRDAFGLHTPRLFWAPELPFFTARRRLHGKWGSRPRAGGSIPSIPGLGPGSDANAGQGLPAASICRLYPQVPVAWRELQESCMDE